MPPPPAHRALACLTASIVGSLATAPAYAETDGPIARLIRPFLGLSSPFPLCGPERLVTRNISFVYPDLLEELHERSAAVGRAPIDLLLGFGEGAKRSAAEVERCRWNKFRLLLQITYFERFDDLLPTGERADRAFVDRVMQVRDAQLSSWFDVAEGLLHRDQVTGFYEWDDEKSSGEPVAHFLARESEILPWMSGLSRTFLLPPRHGARDLDHEAAATLQRWLRMRTPLSSIWPELALQEARKREVANAMRCLRDRIGTDRCDVNLYTAARSCSGSGGRELTLKLLGLFSAQEAFLWRDLGAWVRQNLDGEERDRVLGVFRAGAEVYYASQMLAHRCGAPSLYPSRALRRGTPPSLKSYHYYAMALNAYKLRQVGYPEEVAFQVPTHTGALYKRWAFGLGVIYNTVVGLPLASGSTGDVSEVTAIQELGARLGVHHFARDAAEGRATAPTIQAHSPLLSPWPLSGLRVEGADWDPEVPGRLIVELVELRGPVPVSRRAELQISEPSREILRRRGLYLPRISVTDVDVVAVY